MHKDMTNLWGHADGQVDINGINLIVLWDAFCMRASMSPRVNSRHGRDQRVLPAIVPYLDVDILSTLSRFISTARLSPSWPFVGVNSIVFVHPVRHDCY